MGPLGFTCGGAIRESCNATLTMKQSIGPFRERMARSWEEERQRDLEKVRRSFEAWDHAMTKLHDSIERAETVMLGTRPGSSGLN